MAEGRLTLLYDGECPFCRREVQWLRRRDRKGNMAFEDIAALDFDPAKYGLTRQEVTSALHGILPDGRVVRRMDAVREAYRAVGLGWLIAPTRWPGARGAFDRLYAAFARNRVSLGQWFGRRCDTGQCKIPRPGK